MSKLTKFLGLIILLLTVSVFASAMEAKLEDYGARVDDGIDDSQAVQAAVDAIFQGGGGKILFPSGKIDIKNRVILAPSGYVGGEIKLQGTRGSVIEISVGEKNTAFYAGNLNILTFEDLAFVGKKASPTSPDFYDAKYVIFSNSVSHTNITRCQLYGLAVPDKAAVVYLGNTDTRISDSQIDGSLAQYPDGAAILAENTMGLTVSRTTFYDYANFHGEYLSKTPQFVGSWIKVKGGLPHIANGQRRIVIEDSRFDEGAATAVSIENVSWVNITGISVNVNSTSAGRGIFLKNVSYAKIEQSWFGLTQYALPALDLENVGATEVTSLKFGGGVYFLKQFGTIKVNINYCPECTAIPTSLRKTKK